MGTFSQLLPLMHVSFGIAWSLFSQLLPLMHVSFGIAWSHFSQLPPLHCSTAPLLHCSTAPLLHCSNAPLLHCFTAPLLHCSTAPLIQKLYDKTVTQELGKSRTAGQAREAAISIHWQFRGPCRPSSRPPRPSYKTMQVYPAVESAASKQRMRDQHSLAIQRPVPPSKSPTPPFI